MTTATIYTALLYSLHLSNTLSKVNYPPSVCVIGDVQADYHQDRDPRILMGTYNQMDLQGTVIDDDIVNTSAPIYQHINFGDTGENPEEQYLFKLYNLDEDSGWVLAATLPVKGGTIGVLLTCFQDSLFDCIFDKWYWNYNSYEFPISPLRILGGDCAAGMCLKNLTIQLKPDNEITKANPAPGDYSKLDGEFERTWDNETDRWQWTNQRDPNMRWYYRHNTGAKETYNWVYSENIGDRIACAPGYVEMPLFCNTFVYAGSEGGEDGVPLVSYNPDLPRDILGIPAWAAADNQIATTFVIGVCGVTLDPTVEPTLEPTAYPTMEPTYQPTPTPRCPKEYIFGATDQDTEVELPCPFGWKGTSITRYCNTDAMWVHVEDDCFLISFADDFSYFRDELWQSSTGFEGSVAADTFDTAVVPYLQSFPSFSGPLRLEFSMEINASYCGGFVLQFVDEVYNTTDGDLKASYDCTAPALIFEDEIATQAAITPATNAIDGYILYRTETELFLQPSATVLFSAFSSAHLLNATIENGSYLDAQQLYFGILDNATSQFITLHSLRLTSFVDWFAVQENIWTTFPSVYFFGTYTSAGTGFPALDPVATHSFIEFRHPEYLQANGNSFEFRAPFTIRFIYGFRSFNNTNNGTSHFMLSLSTTTTKSDLFIPNEEVYAKVDLDFVFTDDSVWIGSETADYEVMNKTLCDDELSVEIHISVGNVTVTVYNDDGSECGDISLINTADMDASSLQFNLLKIAPSTDSFVSLSYIDVTAGAEADINTASPTHSPTMAPTVLCAYDGDNVTLNASVFGACEFGYYGPGDVGRCLPSGEIGDWTDGCFQISFSDYFYDFDDEIWQVYTTEGVRGEATHALDGSDSLRFIPDDVALVGVLRSKQRINWPMRIRTVVEKREKECNLWAVGLGAKWDSRSPFSARTNWACQGGDKSKQMSLYNHTFRLYDSRCWNDAVEDTMEVVFSIRDGGTAHGAVVTTSTADCASLKLQVHDILGQSPWEDAYLWFGSYGESEDQDLKDKINQTIVGRFHSMQYTQFYSDFDGLMTHIWDANLSTATEADNALLLAPGDVVVANDALFQFTVPFVVKVGLYRPERGEGDDWSKGEYAHFVSIGGRMDGYVEGMQSGVVQIVWDGKKKVRLVYSGDNIYETGVQKKTASGEDYCNWNEYGTQDVMIYVDSGKITIIDELCNDFSMTAAHDLNRTADGDVNNISLGFIRPDKYNSGYRIGFKYIEAYQLPVAYGGQIANENAESAVVVDILDIYPYVVADDTILGLQTWLFILIVCGAVLICCILYFVVAWKRRIFPFKDKSDHESNMNNMNAHKVPQSVDESNQSINVRTNAESAGVGGDVNAGLNTKSNLAQKLIPETSVDDPNGNANGNANAFAASNNFNGYQMQQQQQQNLRQQQMQQQQQQFSGMDPQSLQYQMYQQQLFYQQQFMQMMMTNPQQQAILMNMNPIQRKQYIQSQMMIYMSRIAAMQQQNMIPIQQMQAQFRESNPGGGGEGGGTEGTGMSTGAFIEGGMGTNAAMNMGYGQQQQMGYGGQQQQAQQMGYGGPQQQQQQMGGYGGYAPPPQQVEMQPIKQNNVDILSEFLNRVPVETFYQMCPIGQDGYARTDENRVRLMVAKFRGISPTDVAETDDAIAYFVNLSIDELKQQLAMLPEPIYELLKGPNYNNNDNYGDIQGVADFLVEFCEKVNLKQIFGQLQSNLSSNEPGLDIHHARIVIANLRDATFGQVSENDPGVKLILYKTMVEMRFYLSNLAMSDLRLLDLKSYHRYAKSGNYKKGAAAANANVNNAANNNQGGGGGGQQGFVFPTINLNYNGDIRQFMPPKFGCFDEIMGFIMNAWPHLNSFKLMFQDDQASWIRITTNIDVQECIKYAVEHKASYLSINIVG